MSDSSTDAGLIWGDDGAPRSSRFDDVYFSRDGGLAESRAVFLEGCDLPGAWSGRRQFTVAELGFGTGLNIAALLELWRRARPPGAHLSIFSIEAYPISAAESARALGAWAELADAAAALAAAWPGRARGFHRAELPGFAATLDVAVMDAADALAAWTGTADAWFLDGFAPARNPGMWSQDVLRLVAERSAPGAGAATYSVAGAVRRGLEAGGFVLTRKPGFGAKRERLEARMPGAARPERAAPRVALIGAGIAGASLARAFDMAGVQASVFDAEGEGCGASGNPSALVTPRLDASLGPTAALYAQAFARAVRLYDTTPRAVIAEGALQLAVSDRDPRRFEAIAGADLFEPGGVIGLSAGDAGRRLGEAAGGGLWLRDARVIAPAVVLNAWLGGRVRKAQVARIERGEGGWRLLDGAESLIATADVVCLAAGLGCQALASGLPLGAVRGQAEWVAGVAAPAAAAFGGYVIPTPEAGLLFGATHDRGDEARDVRAADTARNRRTLAATLPALALAVGDRPVSSRAAIRAATPDYLPIAGALEEDGLFALTGLGSRGFCLAPLLAEHVAALALGAPSPLPRYAQALVRAARFAERLAIGRGRSVGVDREPRDAT